MRYFRLNLCIHLIHLATLKNQNPRKFKFLASARCLPCGWSPATSDMEPCWWRKLCRDNRACKTCVQWSWNRATVHFLSKNLRAKDRSRMSFFMTGFLTQKSQTSQSLLVKIGFVRPIDEPRLVRTMACHSLWLNFESLFIVWGRGFALPAMLSCTVGAWQREVWDDEMFVYYLRLVYPVCIGGSLQWQNQQNLHLRWTLKRPRKFLMFLDCTKIESCFSIKSLDQWSQGCIWLPVVGHGASVECGCSVGFGLRNKPGHTFGTKIARNSCVGWSFKQSLAVLPQTRSVNIWKSVFGLRSIHTIFRRLAGEKATTLFFLDDVLQLTGVAFWLVDSKRKWCLLCFAKPAIHLGTRL